MIYCLFEVVVGGVPGCEAWGFNLIYILSFKSCTGAIFKYILCNAKRYGEVTVTSY